MAEYVIRYAHFRLAISHQAKKFNQKCDNMPRTFRNITQHELIGLDCEIVSASNKTNIGIGGKIIDETQKTIVCCGKKRTTIQKNGSVFRVALDEKKIEIMGNAIITRPEDRIKKKTKVW